MPASMSSREAIITCLGSTGKPKKRATHTEDQKPVSRKPSKRPTDMQNYEPIARRTRGAFCMSSWPIELCMSPSTMEHVLDKFAPSERPTLPPESKLLSQFLDCSTDAGRGLVREGSVVLSEGEQARKLKVEAPVAPRPPPAPGNIAPASSARPQVPPVQCQNPQSGPRSASSGPATTVAAASPPAPQNNPPASSARPQVPPVQSQNPQSGPRSASSGPATTVAAASPPAPQNGPASSARPQALPTPQFSYVQASTSTRSALSAGTLAPVPPSGPGNSAPLPSVRTQVPEVQPRLLQNAQVSNGGRSEAVNLQNAPEGARPQGTTVAQVQRPPPPVPSSSFQAAPIAPITTDNTASRAQPTPAADVQLAGHVSAQQSLMTVPSNVVNPPGGSMQPLRNAPGVTGQSVPSKLTNGPPLQASSAAGTGEPEVPDDLCCPVYQELFVDPVVIETGLSYERAAIEEWFKTKNTCPLTNKTLKSKLLLPNFTVKKLADAHRTEQTERKLKLGKEKLTKAVNCFKSRQFEAGWGLLQQSAESGNPDAQVGIALVYMHGGNGLIQAYSRQQKVFNDQDYDIDSFVASRIAVRLKSLEEDLGLDKVASSLTRDFNRASEWLTKAAQQDVAQARVALAMLHLISPSDGDRCTAVKLLEEGCKRDSASKLVLGCCYLYGIGVARHETEAQNLVKEAADEGLEEALCLAGLIGM